MPSLHATQGVNYSSEARFQAERVCQRATPHPQPLSPKRGEGSKRCSQSYRIFLLPGREEQEMSSGALDFSARRARGARDVVSRIGFLCSQGEGSKKFRNARGTDLELLEIFFDDPIRLPRIRLAGFSRKVDRRRLGIGRWQLQ